MKTNAAKQTNELLTLLIMSTAYIAVFTGVQGFKAMMPLIRENFGLTSAQSGLYSTFFYLSGVILAIFSGRIVDKIGPRKGLIGGVVIIATLMFLHTLAPGFSLLLGLAMITGIGFSVVTPSVNKGIIEMVDPSRRAMSNGIVHAGGGVGGILGASVLPFIGERLGWRVSIVLAVIVAFVMALVLVKLFHPIQSQSSDEAPDTAHDFLSDIKWVLKNPLVWLVGVMGIVMGLSLGNMTIHYTLFLTDDLAFSPSMAGVAMSLFITGGIIGNPGFGYLNDRFLNGNRRLSMSALGIAIALMFVFMSVVMVPGDMPTPVVLGVSVLFGMVFFATMGMLFTTLGDVTGPSRIGTASGFILVATRLSMVIAPPIVGHGRDVTGDYAASWLSIAVIVIVLSAVFFVFTAPYKNVLRRNS